MALSAGGCYVACVVEASRFEVRERFTGPWARGQGTPRTGAIRGARDETRIVAEFTMHVDDVSACIDDVRHRVRVSGHVRIDGLCDRTPCAGEGQLYLADAEVGMRRCEYRLEVRPAAGPAMRFDATRFVRPGRATRAERETWYVRIVSSERPATLIGSGVIRRCARDRWGALVSRPRAPVGWRRFVEREIGAPMVPVPS